LRERELSCNVAGELLLSCKLTCNIAGEEKEIKK